MDMELIKMSEKGQLVVPQRIRESLKLNPGQRFVAFPVKEGVLFKSVEFPEIKMNFESLAREVETQFKKNNIKKSDVSKAIKWAKKE